MSEGVEIVRLDGCTLEYEAGSDRWYEVREERRPITTARAVRLLAGVAGLAAALHVGPAAAYSSGLDVN